jgi:hypothetical protein
MNMNIQIRIIAQTKTHDTTPASPTSNGYSCISRLDGLDRDRATGLTATGSRGEREEVDWIRRPAKENCSGTGAGRVHRRPAHLEALH